MKKKVTASEIYDLLLNEFKIKEQIGSVEIINVKAEYLQNRGTKL